MHYGKARTPFGEPDIYFIFEAGKAFYEIMLNLQISFHRVKDCTAGFTKVFNLALM